MLGKLLKYDLKWVYKVLIVFYVLGIMFSILGRAFTEIENSVIFNIVGEIFRGTAVTMVVNVLINNLMRVWARFTRNLYKDESYLTHTLPVEKKTIYLSKVLSAIITMVTSAVIIVICLAICYYSPENIDFLKTALEFVATTYNSTVVEFLLIVSVLIALELIYTMLAGFIGIILGHKSNNKKMMKSILYGFITYMSTQVLTIVLLFIIGLFNPDIMNLFNTTEMINIDIIKTIMYIGIVIYSVYIIAYYIIGKKLFEKGVNVD